VKRLIISIRYASILRLTNFVDQSDTAMKPEFPSIDPDKMVSPHAQEVEYALILSQMLNQAKDDPSQLRLMVYEFARARLKIDTCWAEKAERERLSTSLETAIQGVEQFSVRREERERLQFSTQPARIEFVPSVIEVPSASMVEIRQVNPAPPEKVYWGRETHRVIEPQTRGLVSKLARFSVGILLFGVVLASAVFYIQRSFPLQEAAKLLLPKALIAITPAVPPAVQDSARPMPLASDVKTADISSSSPPFPLPSDYGVYALNGTTLSELSLLPDQVPDKRVAISTPINQRSHTTLPDGKSKFVIFRRDVAGNAPDRVDVRVVAQVMRAMTFDGKGKASISPVSDAWNIRKQSYEFRVRPIAGNAEMLLVTPADVDFTLPAGRYVLVLKNQGYDFTVAGKVTDPWQCLERTDAANGEFFSDCQKN
jgi:hypothetical protein